MIWKELVEKQIEELEKDKIKESRKMEKLNESDSSRLFSKKVEILAEIKAIEKSITTLYLLLGRANEVEN